MGRGAPGGYNAPIFDSSERFRGYIVISRDSGSAVEFLKLAVIEWAVLPKIYASILCFVESKTVDE